MVGDFVVIGLADEVLLGVTAWGAGVLVEVRKTGDCGTVLAPEEEEEPSYGFLIFFSPRAFKKPTYLGAIDCTKLEFSIFMVASSLSLCFWATTRYPEADG